MVPPAWMSAREIHETRGEVPGSSLTRIPFGDGLQLSLYQKQEDKKNVHRSSRCQKVGTLSCWRAGCVDDQTVTPRLAVRAEKP